MTFKQTISNVFLAWTGLIVLSVLLLYSCKNNIEEIPPLFSVTFKVTDPQNNLINTARVAVYDDFGKFDAARKSYNLTQALAVQTTTEGTCTFSNLPSKRKYYVLGVHDDLLRFPGFIIEHDNAEKGYELPFEPRGGSTFNATLKLSPAFDLVTFWTGTGNGTKLPIRLYLDNDVQNVKQINGTFASAPAPTFPGAVTYKVRVGEHKYQAIFDAFCNWQGSFVATGGTQQHVELARCGFGTVGFYTVNPSTSSTNPITVTVNLNQEVGLITVPFANAPGFCTTPNVLSANLAAGTYTYKAVSQGDGAVWTGRFTVTDNACQLIRLEAVQ